jgi:hypothetical protein
VEESDLSQEQKQALQEAFQRGSAYQELVRTKGWEFVKKYYQIKVQQFASGLLVQESKPISEFEGVRRELIGLRKLLGSIDGDIKTLEDDQQKNKAVAK